MGLFSFKTTDTGESIPNIYSNRETFEVVMIDNTGHWWSEWNYEGYGMFGGKDIYELIAEMNGKTTREEGIDLFFSQREGKIDKILTPNLYRYGFTYYEDLRNAKEKWKDVTLEDCDYQGYFYED